MRTLSSKLIAVGTLGIVVMIGGAMSSRQADAQNPHPGSAPVSIVSPLPLPVTGQTTVSGVVQSAQSGNWTVGIAGQPISVRNIDERGRIPYKSFANCFGALGIAIAVCDISLAAVPSGMRLVVEHVTAEARVTQAGQVVRMAGTGGFFAPKFVGTVPFSGAQPNHWAVNEVVLDFVEAGNSPSFSIIATSNINADVVVTGYLITK
jgi:hypothetical protein